MQVTGRAAQELKTTLEAHATEQDQALRLAAPAGQLTLVLDREREGDEVVEEEGVKVLVIEQDLSARLGGVQAGLCGHP